MQLQQQNNQPIAVVFSIADELADREHTKRNFIIYNLPEASDQSKDTLFFNEPIIVHYYIAITESIRLDKKNENKEHL